MAWNSAVGKRQSKRPRTHQSRRCILCPTAENPWPKFPTRVCPSDYETSLHAFHHFTASPPCRVARLMGSRLGLFLNFVLKEFLKAIYQLDYPEVKVEYPGVLGNFHEPATLPPLFFPDFPYLQKPIHLHAAKQFRVTDMEFICPSRQNGFFMLYRPDHSVTGKDSGFSG